MSGEYECLVSNWRIPEGVLRFEHRKGILCDLRVFCVTVRVGRMGHMAEWEATTIKRVGQAESISIRVGHAGVE